MSEFTGTFKTLSHDQQLNGTLEQVFPLLCPVREYDWIDDWACTMVHSQSGLAEANCVFTTELSGTRLGDASEEVWIVSRYEPPTCIEFVKFAAGQYVIKYEISLTKRDGKTCSAQWVQHLIGLSETGNAAVAGRQQSDFCASVEAMETMLNYYLEHGKCKTGA